MYNSINISITPRRGTSISDVCYDVKILSEHIKEEISFEFNGVNITTENKSITEMIQSYSFQR